VTNGQKIISYSNRTQTVKQALVSTMPTLSLTKPQLKWCLFVTHYKSHWHRKCNYIECYQQIKTIPLGTTINNTKQTHTNMLQ